MKNKMTTRMLAEAGIMIAAAQMLSYIKVFEAPQGGSVTAGSMVPIIIFALRWGLRPGLITGTAYGVLQMLLGGIFSMNPLSIVLDYLLAFGLLGIAGSFGKKLTNVLMGTFAAIFARFICHLLSGVLVWAAYAPPEMNPWVYSAIYNGTYLLPELVITLIIVAALYKPIIKNNINN